MEVGVMLVVRSPCYTYEVGLVCVCVGVDVDVCGRACVWGGGELSAWHLFDDLCEGHISR